MGQGKYEHRFFPIGLPNSYLYSAFPPTVVGCHFLGLPFISSLSLCTQFVIGFVRGVVWKVGMVEGLVMGLNLYRQC
jgi:hypothetical protein